MEEVIRHLNRKSKRLSSGSLVPFFYEFPNDYSSEIVFGPMVASGSTLIELQEDLRGLKERVELVIEMLDSV